MIPGKVEGPQYERNSCVEVSVGRMGTELNVDVGRRRGGTGGVVVSVNRSVDL